MNNFILIFFAFLSTVSWAQHDTAFYHPNGVLASKGPWQNSAATGFWTNFDENGKIKSTGYFKQGANDSLWTFYYPSGFVKTRLHYRLGKKHGLQEFFCDTTHTLQHSIEWSNNEKSGLEKEFFSNGAPRFWKKYQNNQLEGKALEFAIDGRLIKIRFYAKGILLQQNTVNQYDENGLAHGEWLWLNVNMEDSIRCQYHHGQKHGMLRYYDNKGQLLRWEKYVYDKLVEQSVQGMQTTQIVIKQRPNGGEERGQLWNGLRTGTFVSTNARGETEQMHYYEAGLLLWKGLVNAQNVRVGDWEEYYEEGGIKSKGCYENGLEQGPWTYFYTNGVEELKGHYAKGKPEGEWRWYDQEAKLIRSVHYRNGLEEGPYEERNAKGELLAKGEYVDGEREGEWFIRNGELLQSGKYAAGLKTGKWIQRSADEAIITEMYFQQGLPEGKYLWYDAGGKLLVSGQYARGLKVGAWSYHFTEEPLIIHYRDGVEVKYDGKYIKPPFMPDEFDYVREYSED